MQILVTIDPEIKGAKKRQLSFYAEAHDRKWIERVLREAKLLADTAELHVAEICKYDVAAAKARQLSQAVRSFTARAGQDQLEKMTQSCADLDEALRHCSEQDTARLEQAVRQLKLLFDMDAVKAAPMRRGKK